MTLCWSRMEDSGSRPTPRYGHSAVAQADRLFIFGGRNDQQYFDDLYVFDMGIYIVWRIGVHYNRSANVHTPSLLLQRRSSGL